MTNTTNQDKIKLAGHNGTWYVVDTLTKYDRTYRLLEHNTYGEDAGWVAITEEGKVILEKITDGANELEEFLDDEFMASRIY